MKRPVRLGRSGWSWRAVALLLLALLPAGLARPGRAAVTLVYFRAVPGQEEITLQWATATELDNSGFYVTRSQQENGNYERVSAFIFAQGDSLLGATYEYNDTDLQNGVTYWYSLESIDTNQNSAFTDPISAVPGEVQTQTPTLTPTYTPTLPAGVTPTATLSPTSTTSPTATLTRTPTSTAATFAPVQTATSALTLFPSATLPPAASATPAPSTPTANVFLTPNPLAQAPTSTLIPLPSITVTFATPTSDGLGGAIELDQDRLPKQPSFSQRLNLAKTWPFGLLAVLWGAVAAWFYFTYRKLE